MRCKPEMMRLYAVTDRTWAKEQSLFEQVEEAIRGGVTCVQLREKELDEAKFLQEAIEMQKLCARYHVPLIINDHVEIAKKCKAAGVHLGQKDMEAKKAREVLGPEKMCIRDRFTGLHRMGRPEELRRHVLRFVLKNAVIFALIRMQIICRCRGQF